MPWELFRQRTLEIGGDLSLAEGSNITCVYYWTYIYILYMYISHTTSFGTFNNFHGINGFG